MLTEGVEACRLRLSRTLRQAQRALRTDVKAHSAILTARYMATSRRLIIGMSGASGAILGIRLLEVLRSTEIETHLIISSAARMTIDSETTWRASDVEKLARVVCMPGRGQQLPQVEPHDADAVQPPEPQQDLI